MRINKSFIFMSVIIAVLLSVVLFLTEDNSTITTVDSISNKNESLPFKNTISAPGSQLVIDTPVKVAEVNSIDFKEALKENAKESYAWACANRNIDIAIVYVRLDSNMVGKSPKDMVLNGFAKLKSQYPESAILSITNNEDNGMNRIHIKVKSTIQSMDVIRQELVLVKQDRMWVIITAYKGYNAKEGDAITVQMLESVKLE